MTDAARGQSGARNWLGQAKAFVREHVYGEWDLRTEWRVERHLKLPRLPQRPWGREIWAVSVVRDEVDVIGASVEHLLSQGVDHVLVADHMSQDGTRELLEDLSRHDSRVHVAVDSEPGHFQKEKVNRLSRAAWWAGARWIIPFDADEFWFAEGGSIADFLRSQSAYVVASATVNMLPAEPGEIGRCTPCLMDSGGGYGKVAFRAHPLVLVAPGNHGVARVGAQTVGLHNAHLPYRGPVQIARKCRRGAAALDLAGAPEGEGWHWRAGAHLADADIERVWAEMLAGNPVAEIGWDAVGPFVMAHPFVWGSWDPSGELAGATASRDTASDAVRPSQRERS